jgi:hypothetical protein
MLIIAWLAACSTAPLVSVPVAIHAESRDLTDAALLVLTPTAATWKGEPVTAGEMAVTLAVQPPDSVPIFAVDPAVRWETTAAYLSVFAAHTGRVDMLVADDSTEAPLTPATGLQVDVTWLDQDYAVRKNTTDALITGREARMLGNLIGASGMRVLAGNDRPTSDALSVVDAARGQGISCTRADVETLDEGTSTPASGRQVATRGTGAVLPIVLGDSTDCGLPLGRLEATMAQSNSSERFQFDPGPLSMESLTTAFATVEAEIDACLRITRTRLKPPQNNAQAAALAQVDIGPDGKPLGLKVFVGDVTGQRRDFRERCLSRTLTAMTFPTEGERARFVLTVMP